MFLYLVCNETSVWGIIVTSGNLPIVINVLKKLHSVFVKPRDGKNELIKTK